MESCEKEAARLQQRTDQLQAETEALDLEGHPFSQQEHDALRDRLREHKADLAEYRRRCLDIE